jgi:HK97 family phage portal protein
MIKKFFNKLMRPQVEEKGFYPFLVGGLGNNFDFANTNIQWMQYYNTVAPVGDAVDKIAEKGAKIPLFLYAADKKEVEIPVYNHPFLKLLKKPNFRQTQQDFIKEALVHERATGNNFIRVMGLVDGDKINSIPVEFYNLRPDLVLGSTNIIDGRPSYYQYTAPTGQMFTFNRRFLKDINNNLIETYIESNGFSQLYHFKNISTNLFYQGNYQIYGNSPLQSAEIQIGQYFEAAVYNYFLIKNGLSAKNIISPNVKDPISVDQLNKLRDFITKEFSGSTNSGKTIISTLPITSSNLSINPKDMDFKALNEETMNTVYRKLNIPLPLVDANNTSLANMDTSTLMLYDDAILPALDLFCDRIFTFLFRERYKDADQFIRFGFNESSISALQPRRMKNWEAMKKVGDTSVNERREYAGFGRVESEGCDQIFIANNVLPIGVDTNLTDTFGTDQEGKSYLEKKLRAQKNKDGSAFYSEDEIKMALQSPTALEK